MASMGMVLFSLALMAQTQATAPGKDRTATGAPGGTAEKGTKQDAHGASATGGQERGTTGPSTSGWDPAGARATEKASSEAPPARNTAPNPTATGPRNRNRGSWDVPKINTIYGQQSATYEDVIGTRTPMPGIVVPTLPTDEETPAPRQRHDQRRDQTR